MTVIAKANPNARTPLRSQVDLAAPTATEQFGGQTRLPAWSWQPLGRTMEGINFSDGPDPVFTNPFDGAYARSAADVNKVA